MPTFVDVLLFWIPVAVLGYHWLGFPLLLLIVVKLTKRHCPPPASSDLPSITVAIAAWNEELNIAAKLRNCLKLDYPHDKLEILVGTDGVTDETNNIVQMFAAQGVVLHSVNERIGKSAVLNMLIQAAHNDIVLFTDADVLLASDAVRIAAARFRDEKVGVVLFRYLRTNEDGHAAEGLWDRYENRLKELEGKLGTAVGAYGWAMMVRCRLCRPIPADTILDDFVLGTRPLLEGYGAVYEPNAVSMTRVESARVEFVRKARNSRGSLQVLLKMPGLLLPRHPVKAWVLLSHKVLRMLTPFMLLSILLLSVMRSGAPVFAALSVAQVLLYVTTPLVLVVRGRWRKLLLVQYFLWTNFALLAGYWQYFFGRRLQYNWLRTERR